MDIAVALLPHPLSFLFCFCSFSSPEKPRVKSKDTGDHALSIDDQNVLTLIPSLKWAEDIDKNVWPTNWTLPKYLGLQSISVKEKAQWSLLS